MLLSNPDFSVTPRSIQPAPDSLLVSFSPDGVLLSHADGSLRLPRFREAVIPAGLRFLHLSSTGETGIFCPWPWEKASVPPLEPLSYHPVSVFRDMNPEDGVLLTNCFHLWNWYRSHRFCGCCGHPFRPDEKERALRCDACGNLLFPVICPAVITAITSGDFILLVWSSQRRQTHPGLVAGYVEVGETLEHAVLREALEEVGLPLSNLRYLGDQPWGISGSHMFAFSATTDRELPIRLQREELAEARWTRREDLSKPERIVSVAAELIERFRTNRL